MFKMNVKTTKVNKHTVKPSVPININEIIMMQSIANIVIERTGVKKIENWFICQTPLRV